MCYLIAVTYIIESISFDCPFYSLTNPLLHSTSPQNSGFHLHVSASKEVTVSLLMHNNLLSFFTTSLSPSVEPSFRRVFGAAGHRSDARAVTFSKDGFHLLTAAAESLKGRRITFAV